MQINLSDNALCGLQYVGEGHYYGTYTAEGITAIANALKVHASVTKISLAANQLGEEGTKVICAALKANETLKELDLSGDADAGSNIGESAGAKHVADMLSANASLTSLDLSSTIPEWRPDGSAFAKALAPGIAGSASLTSVR